MKTISIFIIFIIFLLFSSFNLSYHQEDIKKEAVNTWKEILIDGKNIAGVRSDGTAWVWKNGKIEQVGNDKDWKKFFVCTPYICQKEDGTIWSWNDEAHPNLGYKASGNSYLTPHKIGSDKWTDVCGGRTVFGLKPDGSLHIWGVLTEYFTDEVYLKQYESLRIWDFHIWQSFTSKVGEEFFLGIQTDGSLWACGKNLNGEFGNGTKVPSNIPVRIGSDNDWSKVSVKGITGSFAIKKNGTLWAWGGRNRRVLGFNVPRGDDLMITIPTQLGTDSDWSDIATGDFHRLALKRDGTLWHWGVSLKLDEGGRVISPTQIGTDNDWVKIDAGLYISVAIKKDGTAWLWGENKSNQLGLNTTLEIVSEPMQLELAK